MNIWRINLKSSGTNPHEFCLTRDIVGIGWPVQDLGKNLIWEEYIKLAEQEKYFNDPSKKKAWKAAINALKQRMKTYDLVWTRDRQGVYYIGQVTGEWYYQASEENKIARMVNLRPCRWFKVGPVDSVPGKIVNSFIPNRTLQRIKSEQITLYSKYVFNKLSHSNYYELMSDFKSDIYSLISSEDCEDIIGIYLQKELDYLFIPSSCKSDTMNYEYELIQKHTGEKAVAQIKNGIIDLDTKNFSNIDAKVFLFSTKGKYCGEKFDNIEFIDSNQMKDFIASNIKIMPGKIRNWLKILDELK